MHIASIGIDLGKTTFHLVALGEHNQGSAAGRLAPGANVVAEMPGCVPSASPSVAPGRLSSWSGVITVTGAKPWSGEMFRPVPASGSGGWAVG